MFGEFPRSRSLLSTVRKQSSALVFTAGRPSSSISDRIKTASDGPIKSRTDPRPHNCGFWLQLGPLQITFRTMAMQNGAVARSMMTSSRDMNCQTKKVLGSAITWSDKQGRQGKAGQGRARQGKAGRVRARQGKAGQRQGKGRAGEGQGQGQGN